MDFSADRFKTYIGFNQKERDKKYEKENSIFIFGFSFSVKCS